MEETIIPVQEEKSEAAKSSSLIASDQVEGTAVVRPDGKQIGNIKRIMIDKKTGQVAYAVMTFGGFLGFGEDFYPLPWSLLTYNPVLDGYEIDITKEQLKNAPKHRRDEMWAIDNRVQEKAIYDYYNQPFYWGM